ncbi:MAG: sulfatase [Verrucomicrobia bacterium]|nr:sulfatase [Verrucomicrobiota bacterium]
MSDEIGLMWRFFKAFLSIVVFAGINFATAAAPRKPNVLFIAIDDLNTRLGCYGFDHISSPNIDKLAQEGVRFDRAYCQYPSCGPSRTSVLTGLRPQTTGMINNRMSFRELAPDAVTLPQLFMKNGYYVARVGKIFHQRVPLDIGTSGADDPASWQEVVNPRGRDKDEEDLMTIYTHKLSITNTMGFLKAEGEDTEQTDGKVVDETIRMLEEHKGESFFIAAGLYRPHTPYIAPKKYFDLYHLEKTKVPELPSGYRKTVPEAALSSTADWPNFGTTEDEARDCILAYDACISFVDTQIGRLLAAVDRLGLRENTIVVLWGDHGYHLGEHGLWRKNSLYEESARAPLIFRVPGLNPASHDSLRIVEFVDIYPTLADLAGLVPPDELEGTSLRKLLTDPAADWNRPAFIQTLYVDVPGYSVRTDRWRYVEWGTRGDKGVELYDQLMDPQEMHNLAGSNQHRATIKELKELINRNWPSNQEP